MVVNLTNQKCYEKEVVEAGERHSERPPIIQGAAGIHTQVVPQVSCTISTHTSSVFVASAQIRFLNLAHH